MIPNTQSPRLTQYKQIASQLRQDIILGRYLDGSRLPPERDLAADMQVAVGTLRQALGLLIADGLIEARQGSGNYVHYRTRSANIYELFHLQKLAGGGQPSARLLALDKIPKPASLPVIGPSALAFRLRRVRYLDAVAVALEEIYIDVCWDPALREAQLPEALYEFYEHAFGLVIAQATDRIGMAILPDWGPDLGDKYLACDQGSLLPFIERQAFDTNGQAVEYSATWFDPAVACYVASWLASAENE